MKITLRKKDLKNNKSALYLDITNEGRRAKQYLKLYVFNKPRTPDERKHNNDTLELAENVRAKRQLEMQNNSYGFSTKHKKNVDYLQYFESLVEKRKETGVDYSAWRSIFKHLKAFIGANRINIGNIDEKWLEDLKTYLLHKAAKTSKQKISRNSAHHYFNRILASLKLARQEKIITDNPGERVGYIEQAETKRDFLTLEELQTLSKTECRYPVLKEAFIFSALTGLRWSDIQKLTWSEVQHSKQTGWSIHFTQKKTDGVELLPISQQARDLLGEKQQPDERVFKGLKYSSYMNVELSRWVMKAKITKNITFHCARHTNATLLLTNGVDIYTVSKLLGHKAIKTTQVYAKIIDSKKIEAVNKLPLLDVKSI